MNLFFKTFRSAVIIALFLIGFLSYDSEAGDIAEEPEARSFLPNFYFKAKNGGIYQHHKDYKLIQPSDELAGTQPGEPNHFDPDAWGWSGGGTIGYRVNERLAVETNAAYLRVSRRHTVHVQGGDDENGAPTFTSLLPILNGTILGGSEQAVEIGGQLQAPNTTAAVIFKYRNEEWDIQTDGVYTLFDDKKYCKADGIFGIGYAFFKQGASFDTTGINFDNGNPTYTYTYERLTDHMAGPRCGLRGELNIYPKNPAVSLRASIIHSLYVARTHFKGEQDFTNAASDSKPRTATSSSIDMREHDTRIVPRLQCEVSLAGKSKIDCEFFYAFDCWWNMSTVDNPTIMLVGGNNVIDDTAGIGTGGIYQHFIGGRFIF
jgi:hypothetical protein